MFKRIFGYTVLTYIVIIAVMLADSNITNWNMTTDHNLGSSLWYFLAFMWWLVPIVVLNVYVVVDWLRKTLAQPKDLRS